MTIRTIEIRANFKNSFISSSVIGFSFLSLKYRITSYGILNPAIADISIAGSSNMPCGSIKAVINFNGSLVWKVEPIKTPTLNPLNSRFIKVEKPKVIAPANIKKTTFKLFSRIVGKLNFIFNF